MWGAQDSPLSRSGIQTNAQQIETVHSPVHEPRPRCVERNIGRWEAVERAVQENAVLRFPEDRRAPRRGWFSWYECGCGVGKHVAEPVLRVPLLEQGVCVHPVGGEGDPRQGEDGGVRARHGRWCES